MARPLRIHVANMPYHLMSRGNAKQCIFEDDPDHRVFLRMLAELLDKFSMTCLAYCLLWNHFHLLVVPTLHTVSRFMQDLNSAYCQGFNRRHGRSGHVLGDRFKGPIVEDDSYLLNALRYIALNPVEAGRAKHADHWPWSSHRAVAGLEECPPFLKLDRVWAAFDTDDPIVGRDRYLTFVNAACAADGLNELGTALFFGGRDFGRTITPLLEPHRANPAFTYTQRYATRPPLAEILDVPDRRPDLQEAARIAFCEHAYLLREIGGVLGRPSATIWRWIQDAKERKETAARPKPAPAPRTPRGQSSIFE